MCGDGKVPAGWHKVGDPFYYLTTADIIAGISCSRAQLVGTGYNLPRWHIKQN
jgi:hypothetical protein